MASNRVPNDAAPRRVILAGAASVAVALMASPALAQAPAASPPASGGTEAAPAPAAATPAPAAAPADAPKKDEDSNNCLLGDFCLGPVVTLGVINPIGIGAHMRYKKNWGAGLDYQFFPSITIGGASAGFGMFSIGARWYPLGGSFFLNLGFGVQSVSASASSNGAEVKASVSIPGIHLGLGWMGRSGFVAGFDLGVLIPLGGTSADVTVTGASTNVQELQKSIDDTKKAAETATSFIPLVPQINLLRLGYLF